MEFSLVENVRSVPSPKLRGTCPACGNATVSKCGSRVIWHWAHLSRRHCDPWWENETPWHRTWKSYFPEGWREYVHVDAQGERHVADVKTAAGFVLEFQNSAMPPQELRSREEFYGDMAWVVNGAPFANQFFVLGRLPTPVAPWVGDIVFSPQKVTKRGRAFWRLSENPNGGDGLVEVHPMADIQAAIDADYVGHHFYDWVRPRSVWFASRAPVYLDFGGDIVWQMQLYGDRRLHCVQAVRKKALVSRYGGAYSEIGSLGRTAVRPTQPLDVVYRGEDDVLAEAIRAE